MPFSKQHTSVGLELLRVSRFSTLEPLCPLSNPGSADWAVTHPSATLQLPCEFWMGRTGNRRPQPWMSLSPEVHVAFVLQCSGACYPCKAKVCKQADLNGFSRWFGVSFPYFIISKRYTLKHHEIEWMFCPILVKKRWFSLGKWALARSYLEGCRSTLTRLAWEGKP